MNEPTNDECLLNDLAYEFTQRLRQGEFPPLEEYVERYPHLAEDIREIFATLMLIEASHDATSETPVGGPAPAWKLELTRLGEYRILREVGRGGMGVVYKAIHETLGRRVALKVLPTGNVPNADHVKRFQREARTAAQLHHTNIVPVFDVGEAEGMYFYAMQFIDGQPLSVLLDDWKRRSSRSGFALNIARWQAVQRTEIGTLTNRAHQVAKVTAPAEQVGTAQRDAPLRSISYLPDNNNMPPVGVVSRSIFGHGSFYCHVARTGKQVAEALAYAHSQGILHRDVKPANLLLDTQGVVWITDFGLARVEGLNELTSPGDVIGTLRYLPPERFEGHVDERGDIYSLGITLYEMLTGRPAFAASTRAGLIGQILHTSAMAPRCFDRHIPRDLETIVLKAMSHDPRQRYSRAAALAEDLDRFITGRPVFARRLGAWGHSWRWCRRNKALAAMTLLAAALFVAIFVVSLVDSIRIRNQLHETQLARREARERLFDSLVSQAHARRMSGERFGRRFESLNVVREATSLARQLRLPQDALSQLRNEAIGALCLPDEEIAQTVDAFPVGTAVVDFDPQIQRYARGHIEGNVTIHRVSDNQVLHCLPSSGPGFELAFWDGVVFSPDGSYLQHRCQDEQRGRSHLRLWDVAGVEPRLAFEISEKAGELTAFAPDGRHLGVVIHHAPPAAREATIPTIQAHVLDLASGRNVARPLAADDTTRLVFHPTEAQLAISDATAVRIIQWDTGTELSRWNRPQTTPLAWSPDGRQLLVRSDEDPKIYRWDVARQRELPPLELAPLDGHQPGHVDRIVFSHRGDRFLSTSRFRYQLWEFPSGQLLWDSPQGALPGIRFSRDDQLLAGFLGVYPKVRILRVADGLELRRLPLSSPVDDRFPKAVMSPDGRFLAATSQTGTVLLDLQTHAQLAVIPGLRRPLVFESAGALLTHANAPEGVVRWPIIVAAETPERVSIGTPQTLTEIQQNPEAETSLFAGLGMWAASRDGRVIATPWQRDRAGAGANIFIAAAASSEKGKYRCVELGTQHDVRNTSVSPDGKWVATGSASWWAKRGQSTDSVTIWDATTGQRIRDLLVGEGCPQFSPDGKWIAVTSSGFPEGVRLWGVGSWKPAPTPDPVPGPGEGSVAFDAESRLMAVYGQQIRLIVPETGREVARLSYPEANGLSPQCFTPDGTRLIAMGIHNGQLYIWVWDLRAIRQQLAELGLDWDGPSAL